MKKLTIFTAIMTLVLLAGCGGGEETAAENTDNNNAAANQPSGEMTIESLIAEHGEDKIKEIYVDIQAHAEASFLTNTLGDITTSELMEMSEDERKEYAANQGRKKGQEVAKRMGEAAEKYGMTMAHWRVISPYADANDWYNMLSDDIEARKAELKAENDAAQSEEGEDSGEEQ